MPISNLNAAQIAALQAHATGQLSTSGLINAAAGGMAGVSPFASLGQAEIVDWVIYDNQTIAAGSTVAATYSLFQTAAGGVSSKTPVQTNMSGQGVLPASQAFVITSISLTFDPTNSFLDITNFAKNSYFTLQVSNKTYLGIPTIKLPGGSVPIRNAVANQGANMATDALLAASASSGVASHDNVYKLRYPIPIWVQEQFIVTITTPANAPTLISATPAVPSATVDTVGNGLNFWVNLNGILYRNVR